MKRAGGRVILGLLLATAAAGADGAACSVQKGLYEAWLTKRSSTHRGLKDSLLRTSAAPDPEKQQSIGEEYQAFFRCLSDVAARPEDTALRSSCDEAASDRVASMVCQSVLYVKTGRTGSKEFLDALPAGRKGAEVIWDLETIAATGQERVRTPAAFLPNGPAYKLIDELFLLVLDGKDTAAAKYFNISALAADAGARHMDEQIKILLRESPAVVVKEWAVLRQYQPKIKKLLSEMTASLPRAEVLKMRQDLVGFCGKDNLDCPEILKVFGRP